MYGKKYFGLTGTSLNLLLSFIGGLDFFLLGYDQGVTGGLLDLPSFTKYFPQIDTTGLSIGDPTYNHQSTIQGIVVASYNLGCFAGAVACISIGNPLGRKRTSFLGCIIMTIGAILQCTSYSPGQLIVGRLVTGVGRPVRIKYVSLIALSLARQRSPARRPSKPPGKNWARCFYERHPELKASTAKALDWNRYDIRDKVIHWFDVTRQVLRDPNVLQGNVYNIDEVKRTTITAIACVSADSRYLNI